MLQLRVSHRFEAMLEKLLPLVRRQDHDGSSESPHPAPRAAVAALLGYGWLLAFPGLVIGIAGFGNLPHKIATASSLGDFVAIGAWTGVAVFAGLFSYWLLRLQLIPPAGRELQPAEAPALFDLLAELHEQYAARGWRGRRKLHRVCVTPVAGVAVVRCPRFGLPFVFENTLCIGLPTLQTLAPLSFRALLARTLGQFHGTDQPVSRRLYELRATWACYRRCARTTPAPLRWLVERFFNWYAPFYERMSDELASAVEMTGDDYALQAVDPESLRDGLVAEATSKVFLNKCFWPALEQLRGKSLQPPTLPFAQLERAFHDSDPREREAWWQQALRLESPGIPSLGQRIADLGRPGIGQPQASQASAAQTLLGESLAPVVAELDAQWWAQHRRRWRRKFERCRKALPRLVVLKDQLVRGRLNDAEVRELVRLAKHHLDSVHAAGLYRNLLAYRPEDAQLQFGLGKRLLHVGDEAGVAALERAMSLDERYAIGACKLISLYRTSTAVTAAAPTPPQAPAESR